MGESQAVRRNRRSVLRAERTRHMSLGHIGSSDAGLSRGMHGAMMLAFATAAGRNPFRLNSEGERRKDSGPQENQQRQSC